MKTYYEVYCNYSMKGDMSFDSKSSVPSLEHAIQFFVGYIRSLNRKDVISADLVLYKKQFDENGNPVSSPEKIVGYEK